MSTIEVMKLSRVFLFHFIFINFIISNELALSKELFGTFVIQNRETGKVLTYDGSIKLSDMIGDISPTQQWEIYKTIANKKNYIIIRHKKTRKVLNQFYGESILATDDPGNESYLPHFLFSPILRDQNDYVLKNAKTNQVIGHRLNNDGTTSIKVGTEDISPSTHQWIFLRIDLKEIEQEELAILEPAVWTGISWIIPEAKVEEVKEERVIGGHKVKIALGHIVRRHWTKTIWPGERPSEIVDSTYWGNSQPNFVNWIWKSVEQVILNPQQTYQATQERDGRHIHLLVWNHKGYKLVFSPNYDELVTLFPMNPVQFDFDPLLGTFVRIPAGKFLMGSPTTEADHENDERQHEVKLTEFEMGKTVVTQEVYARFTGFNPSYFKEVKYCPKTFKRIEVKGTQIALCPDHPVEQVSWIDAMEFIKLVNRDLKGEGYTYFLPTEAQTEYAFRGGTTTAYVSGEDETHLGRYVQYSANSGEQTQSVHAVYPNVFGIYRGSVWEWTMDRYSEDYEGSTGLDPQGPSLGFYRVYRGGGWNHTAQACRSAYRFSSIPWYLSNEMGFRFGRIKN